MPRSRTVGKKTIQRKPLKGGRTREFKVSLAGPKGGGVKMVHASSHRAALAMAARQIFAPKGFKRVPKGTDAIVTDLKSTSSRRQTLWDFN